MTENNAREEFTPGKSNVELKYLDPIAHPERLILQGEQLAEYANAFLKEHAGKPIYAFVYFEENGTVEISYGPVPDEIMLSRAYLAMVSVPSKLAKPGQKPEAPFVEIIKATRGAASVILTADVPVKPEPESETPEKGTHGNPTGVWCACGNTKAQCKCPDEENQNN